MALLIYSRSPYLMTLGKNTIPRPVPQFARLVLREGIKGAWTILTLLVGAGVIGVVGWLLNSKTTSTLIIAAVAAFVFLVLLIGSYRIWLVAAAFIPNVGFEAQRRVDTLNAWRRSRGGTDQDTLIELPGEHGARRLDRLRPVPASRTAR